MRERLSGMDRGKEPASYLELEDKQYIEAVRLNLQ